ncbi:hypothetical protein [Agaribacter flavus]|uniref:Uncharacterized protein n=1 Tax=Agaribacter flavus TaxID=1902781 RepID=A0ABV7FTP7_9ALTE
MKILHVVAILFVSLTYISHSFAQSEESATERVEVIGKKPKQFYLKEYKRLQRNFIASYNDLVSDREMQIVCEMEARTGSRVKNQKCQPRFVSSIMAEETSRLLAMGRSHAQASNLGESTVVKKRVLEKFNEFQKLNSKLMQKHPDLAETYNSMTKALSKYEEIKTVNKE